MGKDSRIALVTGELFSIIIHMKPMSVPFKQKGRFMDIISMLRYIPTGCNAP